MAATLRRGTCPVCGRDVAVRKPSGTPTQVRNAIRAHTVDGRTCPGTGRPSATTPRRTD